MKSEDPQVDETVAKKENIILIKYRFFFTVQGTFERGLNHTTGEAYMYRYSVYTTFVSKNVQLTHLNRLAFMALLTIACKKEREVPQKIQKYSTNVFSVDDW